MMRGTLLCTGVAVSGLITAFPAQAETWSITTIGVLPGGTSSQAMDINSSGQVVGTGDLPSSTASSFVWQAGTLTDIGRLGGRDSIPYAINDAGIVVGESASSVDGFRHAYRWTSSGGMVDLGKLPGGEDTYARGLNEAGDVVGETMFPTGPGTSTPRAWRLSGGTMTDLGDVIPYGSIAARDISDQGDVLLNVCCTASLVQRNGFGVVADLGVSEQTPGAVGRRISRDGMSIVGRWNPGSGGTNAGLWGPSGFVDLGHLPGGTWAYAYDINAAGAIVGESEIAPGGTRHAFMYRCGRMIDLNAMLPASSGWSYLSIARGVSDSGVVVGDGVRTDGSLRGFVMTPPPIVCLDVEPTVASVPQGEETTYTLTATNVGGAPAALTSLTVTMPTGFSYVDQTSAGVTQVEPGVVGQVVTWPVAATLAAGASTTLEFGASASAAVGTYGLATGGAGSTAGLVVVGDPGDAPVTVTAPDPSLLDMPLNLPDGELAAAATLTPPDPATGPTAGVNDCPKWTSTLGNGLSVSVRHINGASTKVARVCFYNKAGRWTFFTGCVRQASGADWWGSGPGYVQQFIDNKNEGLVDDWTTETDNLHLRGGLMAFGLHFARGTPQALRAGIDPAIWATVFQPDLTPLLDNDPGGGVQLTQSTPYQGKWLTPGLADGDEQPQNPDALAYDPGARPNGVFSFIEGKLCSTSSRPEGVYASELLNAKAGDPSVDSDCTAAPVAPDTDYKNTCFIAANGERRFDMDVWIRGKETGTAFGPDVGDGSNAIVRVRYRWRILANDVQVYALVTTKGTLVPGTDAFGTHAGVPFIKEPKFRLGVRGTADPAPLAPSGVTRPAQAPGFTRIAILGDPIPTDPTNPDRYRYVMGVMKGGDPAKGVLGTKHSRNDSRARIRWDYGNNVRRPAPYYDDRGQDSNITSKKCAAATPCFMAEVRSYPDAMLDTSSITLAPANTRKWASKQYGFSKWASLAQRRQRPYRHDTAEPGGNPAYTVASQGAPCNYVADAPITDDEAIRGECVDAVPYNFPKDDACHFTPGDALKMLRQWEIAGYKDTVGGAVTNDNPNPFRQSAVLLHAWEGGRGFNDCELVMYRIPEATESYGTYASFSLYTGTP